MGNKIDKSEPQVPLTEKVCWCLRMQGLNEDRQCGLNYFPFKHQKFVVSAVGGMSHSIGILKTGEFVSWGSNKFGQLGWQSDSYIDYYLYEKNNINPVSFPKGLNRIVIISISAGAWHSACVTDNYQVFAWGLGTDGQLGINPRGYNLSTNIQTQDKFIPTPALVESLKREKSVSVHCGGNFTVVRTENLKIFTFGAGKDGVLGNGVTNSTHTPQEVITFDSMKLKKIVCGFNHCLALSTRGRVYSWGNMFKDILSASQPVLYPQEIEGLEKVVDIACGDYHCCAVLKDSGQLMAWGSNGYGQLGSSLYDLDYYTERPVPAGINEVSHVVCGGLFTVAKMRDNSVFAWGCNRQKQIGEDFEMIVREPSMILRHNQILKKVDAGYSHLFFMTSEILNSDLVVTPKKEIFRGAFKSDDHSTWRDATSDRA